MKDEEHGGRILPRFRGPARLGRSRNLAEIARAFGTAPLASFAPSPCVRRYPSISAQVSSLKVRFPLVELKLTGLDPRARSGNGRRRRSPRIKTVLIFQWLRVNGGLLSARWSARLAVGLGKTIVAAGQPNHATAPRCTRANSPSKTPSASLRFSPGCARLSRAQTLRPAWTKRRRGSTRSRPEHGKEDQESDHGLEFLGDDRLEGVGAERQAPQRRRRSCARSRFATPRGYSLGMTDGL
jgi:hypothetical protein